MPIQRPQLRKRACSCLGSLAVILNQKQVNILIASLLKNINPKDPAKSYPYIETIGAIAGTVGYKLAPSLTNIVNSLKEFCKIKSSMDATIAEQDYSIKEIVLTVFESVVKKCPKEIAPFLDDIISITLELMGYDPNYNPEAAMSDTEDINMEGWGEMEQDERMEDDSSWKARRAAVKLLSTLVKYRYEKVKPIYEKIVNKILERLNERDEQIKCALMGTFTNLVKGVIIGSQPSEDAIESALQLERKSSSEYLLKGLPAAISKIVAHYGDKSMKVREAIASLLLNMALAVPDYMNGIMLGSILPKLFLNFKENESSIKITVFQTLRRLMRTAAVPDGYIANLTKILEIISISIKEDYFKLPAEGLMTAGVLIKLLMKDPGIIIDEAKKALIEIHKLCLEVFKHPEVDQEIKQAALYAAGMVAANGQGILSQKELDDLLMIFHDRMKYEALRFASIKAFYTVVTSQRKPNIEKSLETCMPEIIQMSKKILRQVKLTALETLLGICEKINSVANKFATQITLDILQILRDGDLQLTQLALKILLYVVPLSSEESLAKLLESLSQLCTTTLVQPALEDIIPVYCAISKKDTKNLNPQDISISLWNIANDKTYKSISIIIARLLNTKPVILQKAVEDYLPILSSNKHVELHRKMAAIIIGQIGHSKDLSKLEKFNKLIMDLLKAPEEEIKVHSAICLGNVALGNKSFYIPLIISKLKASQEFSYLMLVAIREIVVQDSQAELGKELVTEVIPALKIQADTDDEGDRTIIAEILGKLLIAQSTILAPEIEQGLINSKENIRATFALCFKFAMSKGKKDQAQFTNLITKLIELLKDKSLKVQKTSLESLTNIARQNSALIRPYVATIQASALPHTILRPELVTIVDLGPLKHRNDLGEPIRKGAYTLIENMLISLYDKMELSSVVDRLIEGLVDESEEVQGVCQQILIRICEIRPDMILTQLEKLLDQIQKSVRTQMDKLKKVQDVDRSTDNIRSCLRVLIAMSKLPEIDLNQKYQDAMSDLMKDKMIHGLFDELNMISKA